MAAEGLRLPFPLARHHCGRNVLSAAALQHHRKGLYSVGSARARSLLLHCANTGKNLSKTGSACSLSISGNRSLEKICRGWPRVSAQTTQVSKETY